MTPSMLVALCLVSGSSWPVMVESATIIIHYQGSFSEKLYRMGQYPNEERTNMECDIMRKPRNGDD
jgi:hypothetical protein